MYSVRKHICLAHIWCFYFSIAVSSDFLTSHACSYEAHSSDLFNFEALSSGALFPDGGSAFEGRVILKFIVLITKTAM